MGIELLRDRDWLHEHYVVRLESRQTIAALVGCSSPQTVANALTRLDIPIRRCGWRVPREKRARSFKITKACDQCGAEFRPRGPAQRCCLDCPTRMVGPEGYVVLFIGKRRKVSPIAQQMAKERGGSVLEHRLVAAEKLGRLLRPDETVHHLNGNRADNRPDNLQVRTGRHGNGVALVCGDCGSSNIVHAPIGGEVPAH